MGLSTQGLHHHAWLGPGSRTSFLTFLDHRLVQEAHSGVIYRLQIEEMTVRARVDLVAWLPLVHVCSAPQAPPAA